MAQRIQHDISERQIRKEEFEQREHNTRHHHHSEDMEQYNLLKVGDPKAPEAMMRIMRSGLPGRISDDPVRNQKYLFVSTATLATRTAIEAGMEEERAYIISDLYIRKMDHLKTAEEVLQLAYDMFSLFTGEIADLKKATIYSKHIVDCINYIYEHLHETILLDDVAKHIGLNASYLSDLFKKETGMNMREYVLLRKIESAKNLLRYSDYSYSDIAAYLSFSSQSHFIRKFKEATGYTPKTYRNLFFNESSFGVEQ